MSETSSLSRQRDGNLYGSSKCDVCESKLSRTCEAIRSTKLEDAYRNTHISLDQFSHGARTGCPDCALFLKAVQCYPAIDNAVAFPMISKQKTDQGFDVVDIDLDVRGHINHISMPFQFNVDIFRMPYTLPLPAQPEPQWSNIRQLPFISENTSSKLAGETMIKWIEDCNQTHELCRRTTASPLPKRILEIQDDCVVLQEPVHTSDKYACLSHCWGKNGASLQLTTATMETLKAGLPRAELPKTFEDAVTICHKLSIQYLWIDALCILQDSIDDWQEAATSMASIYKNSFITIAATSAKDSDSGCFSQTRDIFKVHKLDDSGLYARKRLPFLDEEFSQDDQTGESNMPLLGRGWVFQERLLSTRLIHFTLDQLIWECKSAFSSECQSWDWIAHRSSAFHESNDWIPSHKGRHDDLAKYWQVLVSEYTRLDFSYDRDLLPALAGIIEGELRRRPNDLYIAGMWRSSLLRDLAFDGNGHRIAAKAPTWSWAYLSGPVLFRPYHPLPNLRLLDVQIELDGPANIGETKTASAWIRGSVLEAKISSRCTTVDINDSWTLSQPYELTSSSVSYAWVHDTLGLEFVCFAPVDLTLEDGIVVLIISGFVKNLAAIGIALQEVAPGRFEKVGTVSIDYIVEGEEWSRSVPRDDDEAQRLNKQLQRLPVRDVEII